MYRYDKTLKLYVKFNRWAVIGLILTCCQIVGLARSSTPSEQSGHSSGSLSHGASGLAHGVPDFCSLAGAVIVPAGQTQTIAGPQTFSCLGIHGTATITGAISATNILVYADGSLTLADGAEITIRNTPIDSAFDPEQFGTGLIVFGTLSATGQTVRPFVRVGAEIAAGSTTVLLSEPSPAGWKAGDKLILPDSRQMSRSQLPVFPYPVVRGILPNTASQSEVVEIGSISGATVTLASPTQFGHRGARLPDGTLTGMLPHVANQTRSIVIKSESASGTRGHTLFAQRANVDVRYVEFQNLGRTLATRLLDSATFSTDTVTHVGTNQIGRYPIHFHHVFGPSSPQANGKQFTVIGASVHGFSRFGIALHNSSYGLVQDSVVFDGHGAAIVTEDGSERDNQLYGNIMIKINPPEMTLEATDTNPESESDPNARKGNCFWFRGNANDIRHNVCADTREGFDFSSGTQEGVACANCTTLPIRLPKAPGLDTTIDANITRSTPLQTVPIAVEDNEIYSTTEFGLGLWMTAFPQYNGPPIKNLRIWHATHQAVFFKYSDGALEDCALINEGGLENAVVHGNSAVGNTSIPKPDTLTNCSIRGFDTALIPVAVQLGLPKEWTIRNSTIQARRGILVSNRGEGSVGALVVPINTPPDQGCIGGYGIPSCPERPKVNLFNVQSLAIPGSPLVTMTIENFTGQAGTAREPELRVYDYQGVIGNSFRVWFPVTANTFAVAPCATVRSDFPGVNQSYTEQTPGTSFTCAITSPPIPSAPRNLRIVPGG